MSDTGVPFGDAYGGVPVDQGKVPSDRGTPYVNAVPYLSYTEADWDLPEEYVEAAAPTVRRNVRTRG